jgi:hypothetical protein
MPLADVIEIAVGSAVDQASTISAPSVQSS